MYFFFGKIVERNFKYVYANLYMSEIELIFYSANHFLGIVCLVLPLE